MGDKDNKFMRKRIRIHGNFYEYVPLALIAFALLEIQNIDDRWLHALAITLLLSRTLHLIGIRLSSSTSIYRASGSLGTHIVLVVCALLLIFK